MKFTPTGINRGLDWTTFSLYLCLVLVGWLMIFTVGYEEGYHGINDFLGRPIGKQTIWIGLSFIAMFLLYFIDWKFFQTFSYLFYIIGLVLLILVLFFGKKINGASSWFMFGGISFQPSELAKLGTCLALSTYLSSFSTSMQVFKHQAIAVGLFVFPMLLILLQPDAGSALVFLSFMIVLYRAGLSMILGLSFGFKKKRDPILIALVVATGTIYLVTIDMVKYALPLALVVFAGYSWLEYQNRKERLVTVLVGGLMLGSVLIFTASYAFNNLLEKHQQDRINVWLNPSKSDPRGALYNLNQSKMAIGSGGAQGKGFLKGVMTKLEYVPEQFTDFIFCTIGEEQGFAGSFSIMVLFFLLLYRLVMIAERQRSSFSRFYCYGIAGILFTHFFINIGMTMGLMPIIGIPLPFISKGGSSLLIFSLMIGLVLKLDSNRFRI